MSSRGHLDTRDKTDSLGRSGSCGQRPSVGCVVIGESQNIDAGELCLAKDLFNRFFAVAAIAVGMQIDFHVS